MLEGRYLNIKLGFTDLLYWQIRPLRLPPILTQLDSSILNER